MMEKLNKDFLFDKKIKKYQFTTNYFLKAKNLLETTKKGSQTCTMQFIHFNDEIVVCGISEIISLLKKNLTKKQRQNLTVYACSENSLIDKNTPILVITGKYTDFGWLENIIDGILCRRCSVATNTYECLKELLDHQKIIYMSDRTNNYFDQAYDAYPAYLQGIKLFVTQEQIKFFNKDSSVKVIGTMPHALIQQYKNDLNSLICDYKKKYPHDNLYCLIDFDNNVINTLNKIKPVFDKLSGIRIDTSSKLIDKSLPKSKTNYGINANLVNLVKNWLIDNGFADKKIIVSSQINPQIIKQINQKTNGIDFFGIGSYLIKPSVHVSADLVMYNDEPFAKVGRKLLKNWKKLQKISLL